MEHFQHTRFGGSRLWQLVKGHLIVPPSSTRKRPHRLSWADSEHFIATYRGVPSYWKCRSWVHACSLRGSMGTAMHRFTHGIMSKRADIYPLVEDCHIEIELHIQARDLSHLY